VSLYLGKQKKKLFICHWFDRRGFFRYTEKNVLLSFFFFVGRHSKKMNTKFSLFSLRGLYIGDEFVAGSLNGSKDHILTHPSLRLRGGSLRKRNSCFKSFCLLFTFPFWGVQYDWTFIVCFFQTRHNDAWMQIWIKELEREMEHMFFL